jgi:protein-S-isoprenylcysteine O-methyltransferase Ste14
VSRLPSLGPRGEGWVAIQGVILAAVFLGGLLEAPGAWTTWTPVSIGGLVLVAVGGLLAVLGVLHLGRSLTALPHPRDGSQLVETGVYGLVRHPIYGGLVISTLGYGLAMHALLTALIGTAVLLGFFRLKSAREEVWLEHRYEAYATYRARTRRMLPFIY